MALSKQLTYDRWHSACNDFVLSLMHSDYEREWRAKFAELREATIVYMHCNFHEMANYKNDPRMGVRQLARAQVAGMGCKHLFWLTFCSDIKPLILPDIIAHPWLKEWNAAVWNFDKALNSSQFEQDWIDAFCTLERKRGEMLEYDKFLDRDYSIDHDVKDALILSQEKFVKAKWIGLDSQHKLWYCFLSAGCTIPGDTDMVNIVYIPRTENTKFPTSLMEKGSTYYKFNKAIRLFVAQLDSPYESDWEASFILMHQMEQKVQRECRQWPIEFDIKPTRSKTLKCFLAGMDTMHPLWDKYFKDPKDTISPDYARHYLRKKHNMIPVEEEINLRRYLPEYKVKY